jgi:hypothetical protein
MAKKGKLRAQASQTAVIMTVSGAITSVLNTAIMWGALVAIAYIGYLSIVALAGKTTLADIGIKFLANLKISVIVPYAIGVGGIGYGLLQRRLRKKRVEELSAHCSKLEHLLDPKRSSSGISPQGTTGTNEII